jgi:hypothetical protein
LADSSVNAVEGASPLMKVRGTKRLFKKLSQSDQNEKSDDEVLLNAGIVG